MHSHPTDTPPDPTAPMPAHAGRLMRTHVRQTWLVPLLAVPLSQVAFTPRGLSEMLDLFPPHDLTALQHDAAAIDATASAVAASNGTRGLTDDEAWTLVRFSQCYAGLGYAILIPSPFLLVGMEAAPGLPAGPRLRAVAEWIASGAVPVPMAAFIAARALGMADHPPQVLPKIDSRYAQVARAIDRRLEAEGVTTWEDALALAHRFWSAGGWRDLGVWQEHTFFKVETQEIYKTERDIEQQEHETQRRRHRAERKRLQESVALAQEELRRLRPLRTKVDGLRVESERLRTREAELVQARDRAVSRAKALETANAKLEGECREASRRLAALTPPPEPEPEPECPLHAPPVGEPELPTTLLAGRVVFFFTGELRRSSAEATAESLRALGAEDIRTFRLRQGSDGPDAYPPDALVIVDIRFLGHSQSGLIEDRAHRSGARFLAVRSGKGSLARTVAATLI